MRRRKRMFIKDSKFQIVLKICSPRQKFLHIYGWMDKVKTTGVHTLLQNVIVNHIKSKWPMIAVAFPCEK
jgi:hypothetical protein